MARQIIERAKKFIRFLKYDLWRIDLAHDSKFSALGVEALRVIHLVLKGIRADHCMLRAAALTYATLMALAPFLIILFSIANAIGYATARAKILEAIQPLPVQQRSFFTALLENLDGVSPAVLGGVTGIIFLYIVFKLLSEIEESFNQIWGVKTSRSVLDKVRNYISVLVVVPALMLVAQTASGTLSTYSAQIEWLGPVVRNLLQLAPVLIMTLSFIALFLFLPNTKVHFRAALTGALSSASLAILLQVFLVMFGKAVFSSGKYSVYGSFAAIPIFLFWVYLNWGILLFGAELAFAIQNRETFAAERQADRASVTARLHVALEVMQAAVRSFQESGTALDVIGLARDRHIPLRLMNRMVEVLERGGFLGRIADGETQNYALLHDPQQLSAKQIYDLILTDGAAPEELGLTSDPLADDVLASADAALLDVLGPRKFQNSSKNE